MTGHDPKHDTDPSAARALFERACQRLDPAMGNRLRLARRAALSPPTRFRTAWLPAGAAIATLLALGVAWWLPEPATTSTDFAQATTDTPPEWVASDEDADMYAWLAEAPVAIDNGKGGAL